MKAVTVYGAAWCQFCRVLQQKLDTLNVYYQYKDVDNPAVRQEMSEKTSGNQTIPVLFVDERYWINPDSAALAELFSMKGKEA